MKKPKKSGRTAVAVSRRLKPRLAVAAKKPVKKAQKARIKTKIRQRRPLHKKLILHPVSVLLLLFVTVLLVQWTYSVVADSYDVSATVPASPLLIGATITSPTDAAVFSTQNSTVTGSCPDGSYVKLYDNNLFSGVDFCSAVGTFSIQISLYQGSNVLIAQDFNVTDQQGPATPGVTVTYTPPATPTSPATPPSPGSASSTGSSSGSASRNTGTGSTGSSGSTTGTNAQVPPLLIITDFHYKTFVLGSPFSWAISIKGGQPPYSPIIDWGDGSSFEVLKDAVSPLTIKHIYKSQGYYKIKVTVIDALKNSASIQLFALIRQPGSTGIITYGGVAQPPGSSSALSTFYDNSKVWLLAAWPALIILLLMATSFWLGERQEYHQIIKENLLISRKRAHY
jgi:hypothetical protein